jgi:hypothetical protein
VAPCGLHSSPYQQTAKISRCLNRNRQNTEDCSTLTQGTLHQQSANYEHHQTLSWTRYDHPPFHPHDLYYLRIILNGFPRCFPHPSDMPSPSKSPQISLLCKYLYNRQLDDFIVTVKQDPDVGSKPSIQVSNFKLSQQQQTASLQTIHSTTGHYICQDVRVTSPCIIHHILKRIHLSIYVTAVPQLWLHFVIPSYNTFNSKPMSTLNVSISSV